jgi:chitinase
MRRLQVANPGLRVWLTVPVAPSGMTAEGVAFEEGALAAGVQLTGDNVMTMDYGGSRAAGQSMSDASIAALLSTWQQLDGAYVRAGSPKTEKDLWAMIGATPMIGQNDVPGEVFSLDDATKLMAYARTVDLGRVSFWSANRDTACGSAVDGVSGVSNTCSGVQQQPLAFSRIFDSSAPKPDDDATPVVSGTETRVGGLARDDPRTSPYPLWRAAKTYTDGMKVVWQGRVYQAKWFTKGNQPDAPVKDTWETPWRYLGPVLDSDRDAVAASATVVGGERPKWSAERVYVAGDEVELDNGAFRAKWWTQGDQPQEDPDSPYDNPWEFLGHIKPEAAP